MKPKCRGCATSVVPPAEDRDIWLCEVCQTQKRLGMDWRTVYDGRKRKRGEIPANLLKQYPELNQR